MDFGKRGQISTEYMIVVAFIVFLLLAVLGIALFYAGGISDQVRLDQVRNFATKVVGSAESVFFSGEPSRVQINAYLPQGVESIDILSDSIVFNVSTSSGDTRIAYSSNVPITGSLSTDPGTKIINIVAQADSVLISEA